VFNTDNGLAAASIVCYSKGFVVGQDNGVVTIFERDEKEFYRKARSFAIENNPSRVRCDTAPMLIAYTVCGEGGDD
jgi:Asp/Glu/hydantoin racemase